MMRKTRYWLCLLSILALSLGVALFVGAHHEAPPRPRALGGTARGQVEVLFEAFAIKRPAELAMAPDIPLTDTQGNPHSLNEFRGKLVLVNFWATWCPPCLMEMPWLNRLYAAYRDKGFVVVAISIDAQGPEYVRKYMTDKRFRFPAFSDPHGIRTGVPFGLVGLPTSYLIAPGGELLGSIVGARDWAGPEAIALIGALTDAVRNKESEGTVR